MIAEYLATTGCCYTLSMFRPEVALDNSPQMTRAEIIQVLQIDRASPLYPIIQAHEQETSPAASAPVLASIAAVGQHKREAVLKKQDSCLVLSLVRAIGELGQLSGRREAETQTSESDPHHLQLQLHRVEQLYLDGKDAERAAPFGDMQRRLAIMQRQYDERSRMQVQFQVRNC